MKTPILSPWRWAVLGSFMANNLTIQTLWISYAPVSGPAALFYGVNDFSIGLLAMVFMLAFIPLSLPVSWALDTWGFRIPVSLGAVLTGVFGLCRGLAGDNYTLVLLSTIGMALAQPLLLNSWTKVPALWFPPDQRASAVGLVTVANLLGTALGMLLPPLFLEEGISIPDMQLWFGVAAMVSALSFVLLARERPPQPVEDKAGSHRTLVLTGLRHAMKIKAFWYSLLLAFIGLGIFNGVTTWIESIIRLRGFSTTDAGNLGAIMIVAGLLGAVIIPALSDREGKRRKYLFVSLAATIPGILGLAFAQDSLVLYVSAAWLGFFLVSTLPVAMQYAAEITRPTPEGTSNGLMQLFGQGAVVFVWFMEFTRSPEGSFTPSLLVATGLCGLGLFFVARLPEPKKTKAKKR